MSYSDNHSSLAIQAHCTQNLYVPIDKDPNASPLTTSFPGHDTFQNGIIKNGQPTTFYTAATNRDIENIKNGNSYMSGFLSDEATINACRNADGVFDANEYASKTQTQPWRASDSPHGTDYTYRENLAALDVNWDKLNKPENADLKGRLCDSDGNLRCAYGKVEKNTHWGDGGGNQYYINKNDFNEGVNRGVFEYNGNKTLRESDGSLVRNGISEDEYDLMNANRQINIENQLSNCTDKTAVTDAEKAKSLNEITSEKATQLNSAKAPAGDYLAKPDPAYNYSQNASVSKNDGVSPKTNLSDKVADGGARAPNNIRGNTDNPTSDKKPSNERGSRPEQNKSLQKEQSTNTVRGVTPEQDTMQRPKFNGEGFDQAKSNSMSKADNLTTFNNLEEHKQANEALIKGVGMGV